MARLDIHVAPGRYGWSVRRRGEPLPLAIAPTRAQALAFGRDLARREKVALVEHGSGSPCRRAPSAPAFR